MKQEKRFFLSVWWIVFPPPLIRFFSACRVVGFLYTVNLGTYTHEKKTSNTRTNKSSRRIRNDRSKTTEHWFSMPDRGTQIYACLCFACWVVLSGFDLYSIARNKASPIQKKTSHHPPPLNHTNPKTRAHTHTHKTYADQIPRFSRIIPSLSPNDPKMMRISIPPHWEKKCPVLFVISYFNVFPSILIDICWRNLPYFSFHIHQMTHF